MSAKGMKQGSRASKGANRQEGERPWSRNVPGTGTSGEQWTFDAWMC